MSKNLFTSQQLQEIEQSVKQAESISGSEIVPVFVRQSAVYEMALWRGGFLASLLVGIVMVILYYFTDILIFLPPYFWSIIPITAGLLGALAVSMIPEMRRWLIGRDLMHAKVGEKAKALFYDHNVSVTEQRSGIMLMISFFEKETIILADVGIAELVDESIWRDIIADLSRGIRKGEITKSISDAILKCGNVVADSGLQRGDDGRNELSDSVILEN